MHLDSASRHNIITRQEGIPLQSAGDNDFRADMAECCADGALNALIRLKGREHAAHFAYALADRTTAGLREPTVFAVPPAAAPALEAVAAAVEPAPKAYFPNRTALVWGWIIGGLAVAGLVHLAHLATLAVRWWGA